MIATRFLRGVLSRHSAEFDGRASSDSCDVSRPAVAPRPRVRGASGVAEEPDRERSERARRAGRGPLRDSGVGCGGDPHARRGRRPGRPCLAAGPSAATAPPRRGLPIRADSSAGRPGCSTCSRAGRQGRQPDSPAPRVRDRGSCFRRATPDPALGSPPIWPFAPLLGPILPFRTTLPSDPRHGREIPSPGFRLDPDKIESSGGEAPCPGYPCATARGLRLAGKGSATSWVSPATKR